MVVRESVQVLPRHRLIIMSDCLFILLLPPAVTSDTCSFVFICLRRLMFNEYIYFILGKNVSPPDAAGQSMSAFQIN